MQYREPYMTKFCVGMERLDSDSWMVGDLQLYQFMGDGDIPKKKWRISQIILQNQ